MECTAFCENVGDVISSVLGLGWVISDSIDLTKNKFEFCVY